MSTGLQDEFSIAAFEAGEVDPARFNHEAHVYVGWLYVEAYASADAIALFDAALRRFTEKIGATGKYSAMITWLFLLLIDERTQEGEDWPSFRARNRDLIAGRPTKAAA